MAKKSQTGHIAYFWKVAKFLIFCQISQFCLISQFGQISQIQPNFSHRKLVISGVGTHAADDDAGASEMIDRWPSESPPNWVETNL